MLIDSNIWSVVERLSTPVILTPQLIFPSGIYGRPTIAYMRILTLPPPLFLRPCKTNAIQKA